MEKLQAEVNKANEKIEDEIMAPIQGYGYKNASTCFQRGVPKSSRHACVERALDPSQQVVISLYTIEIIFKQMQ